MSHSMQFLPFVFKIFIGRRGTTHNHSLRPPGLDMHICIGVVYRPPSSSMLEFLDSIEEILGDLVPKYDIVIVGADFNIDCLNKSGSNYVRLNGVLGAFGLIQIINESTRITAASVTILDLCICSDDFLSID